MYKDIELFNPKFVRICLPGGYNYYFDYVNGKYLERKDNIELTEFLKDKDNYEYHIAVASVDNKRVLLVFESDKDNEIITRLAKVVRDRNFKFFLKESGNKSLHLIIPVTCANEIEYTKLWDSIFYILSEEDRKAIDTNLRNYGGQIRGFYSLHLKTYNKSKVVEGEHD